jgi:predicted nuclease with TOPRIM domain
MSGNEMSHGTLEEISRRASVSHPRQDKDHDCYACKLPEFAEQAEKDRDGLLEHVDWLTNELDEQRKETEKTEEERDDLRGECEALKKENGELDERVAALEAPRTVCDCVACMLGMREKRKP